MTAIPSPALREALEAELLRLRAVVNELQSRLSGGKDYLGPALCVCERREDGHVTGWRRDCDVHGDPAVTMPPGWLSPDCAGCTATAVRVERLRAGAADQLRRADEAWRLVAAALDLVPAEVAVGTPVREFVELRAADRAREYRHATGVEGALGEYRHGIADLLFRVEHGVEPQAWARAAGAVKPGAPLSAAEIVARLKAVVRCAGRAQDSARTTTASRPPRTSTAKETAGQLPLIVEAG